MSLLSTDIRKVKRLSIKEISLKATEIKTQEVDKLIDLVQKVVEVESNYCKEDIVARIKEATKVNQERAEIGFNLILKAGLIEATQGGRYYLRGSTPF